MCGLCNKIYTPEEAEKWKDDSWWEIEKYDSDQQYTIISKNNKNNFGLWHRVEDCYYNGCYLIINYCPLCGRKLC